MGLDLLPATANYDYTAVASGNWSDPNTWDRHQIPTPAGGTLRVAVPAGRTVTVDGVFGPTYGVTILELEGTLFFPPDRSTRLMVDTLVSLNGGTLQVGGSTSPVLAQYTAEIVITDNCTAGGSCFDAYDDEHLGQGLILNGPTQMFGAPKDPFVEVSSGYNLGSDRLIFEVLPAGWQVGDEIVIAPTAFARANSDRNLQQAEKFRIRGLGPRSDGKYRLLLGTVTDATVAATLRYSHVPYPGLAVHVANLTRNVVVRSQHRSENDSRGHVLITSTAADIRHVEIRDMGRTDKTFFVDDPRDPPTTAETDAVRANKRSRYPLHFHRTGSGGGLAKVTGAVVNGSPGWGFVNHSSNVNFESCVSFDVDGAGFVAEAGNETGLFKRNIAIQGFGDPDDGRYVNPRFEDDSSEPEEHFDGGRNANGDLGFTGDGFWVQSPAVAVFDNVAAGFQGHGFALWNMGLLEPDVEPVGEHAGFDKATVSSVWGALKPLETYRTYNDAQACNYQRALPNDFPANLFTRNTAYASYIGLMVRFHNHSNTRLLMESTSYETPPGLTYPQTTINNMTAWNNEVGLALSYVFNLKLVNARVFTNQECTDVALPALSCLAVNANKSINSTATVASTTNLHQLQIAGYYHHAIDLWQCAPANEPRARVCFWGPSIDVTLPSQAIRWGACGGASPWLPQFTTGCLEPPP